SVGRCSAGCITSMDTQRDAVLAPYRSGLGIAIKFGLEDAPPLRLGWLRFVLGALTVLVWALWIRVDLVPKRREAARAARRGRHVLPPRRSPLPGRRVTHPGAASRTMHRVPEARLPPRTRPCPGRSARAK